MSENITYSRADQSDLSLVESLVRKEYIRRGYTESLDSTRHSLISDYLYTAAAATFIASIEGAAIGTVSVVQDSERGLPMDTTFKDQTDILRASNHTMAEASQLAIDQSYFTEHKLGARWRTDVLVGLFSHAFHFSRDRNIDYLCLSSTPQHGRFYRLLSFEYMGEPKWYNTVQTMAVAMKLPLNSQAFEKSRNPIIRKILHHPIEQELLVNQ